MSNSAALVDSRSSYGGAANGKFVTNLQRNVTAMNAAVCSWKALMICSVLFAVLACLQHREQDVYSAPEWQWDHNVYVPRQDVRTDYTSSSKATTTSTTTKYNNPSPNRKENSIGFEDTIQRVSLMAQAVTSRPLRKLTDISSLPNRAYARQWGMDYVLYDSGRGSRNSKSCFDKVLILNTILDKQEREAKDFPPLWPHGPRVRYDALILLPPDSIVTELDMNLLHLLLPTDKLVAIAGWSSSTDDNGQNIRNRLDSTSDIVLFNLSHRHSDAVAKLWWDLAFPREVTCGANNDLGMLISAIAEVMEPGEDLTDLIEPLQESGQDGFVGDPHLIKCLPPSVPGSRSTILQSNLPESRKALQETADAVCYRFYPKCDVLS
jgi:hypothetical protein